jgi:hypothetical protein
MKKYRPLFSLLLLSGVAILFSGCFGRGEDDPFFSLHSRDARLTQKWKMVQMEGTEVNTIDGQSTTTRYEFDGTSLFVTTDGQTESYGYDYRLNIGDNGDVVSTETFTDPSNPNETLQTSTKTSFWFWSNDNQNKTTVNLDITGILSAYSSYDIPRLAWSDMTLVVNFSDNYQEIIDTTVVSSASTVDFEIRFDYDNGRD